MLGPALTDLMEDYLLLWILRSVGLGIALPQLAVVTRGRRPDARFRARGTRHDAVFRHRAGIRAVAGTDGFVVLGAVTPDVTPVMTDLAGGDTALSTTAQVVIGVGSVGFIPLADALVAGGIDVPTMPIVERLVVAVVVPVLVAVGARAWQPDRVGGYGACYRRSRQ